MPSFLPWEMDGPRHLGQLLTLGHASQCLAKTSLLRTTMPGVPRNPLDGISIGLSSRAWRTASGKTDNQQRLRNAIWRSLYDSKHEAIAEYSIFANFSRPFLNLKNESELKALAALVAFLASAQAGFMSGEVVHISGGRYG